MQRDTAETAKSEGLHRPDASSALRISIVSVAWTVVSSSAAIVLGIRSDTSVLVAFGAVGCVDAVGSVVLVYHFRHALRHDEMSEDIEKLAHRIVLIGLVVVGGGAVVSGLARLSATHPAQSGIGPTVIAATSFVALTVLSIRKQTVGRRVSSPALLSDGHLSAVGATQAAVALLGTAVARWLNWDWADALATTLVGCIAVTLAVLTWTAEQRRSLNLRDGLRLPATSFVLVTGIAFVDAVIGPRLILIGLLVIGPGVAAVSLRGGLTAAVSAWSLLLAIVLGAPDRIWLTAEHAMWVGGILVVGVANTAIVSIVRRYRQMQHVPQIHSG